MLGLYPRDAVQLAYHGYKLFLSFLSQANVQLELGTTALGAPDILRNNAVNCVSAYLKKTFLKAQTKLAC
jgi:hypothetical protein